MIEEFHEKQEQVKELLLNIGVEDHATVVHDEDGPDNGALPIYHDESLRNRNVSSSAALSVIRLVVGKQHISDKGKAAIQGHLNHFLGNLDIVCKFLEVSRLSFSEEFGPKLKEGYVLVKHLDGSSEKDTCPRSWLCSCCCGRNWQKVRLVLKPGCLAFLGNHFDTKLLDIERNLLLHAFKVCSGNRSINIRTTSNAKVLEWISAINEVESQIYITGWWLCPELYLRRPYHNNTSFRLDILLEAKAKEEVQIHILLHKEVSLALKINSLFSKRKLLSIHENVKVLRYPDHLSTGVYLWSHHEKLVIVDNKMCYIGELDLCFGRFDTTEHKISDLPPFLWLGRLL
ncbi:phospholipase D [Salvia divinorum]|uniref:phospholipase D n=1 Tax=Salvia divinorum TaxID=28513 RepID=A0ABD1GZH5_SALDI